PRSEPHVDIEGIDLEMDQLQDAIGQMQGQFQTMHQEQTQARAALTESPANQRREFKSWLEDHAREMRRRQDDQDCHTQEVADAKGRGNPNTNGDHGGKASGRTPQQIVEGKLTTNAFSNQWRGQ
uniref:Uncharacterized protein n=1 Tax=Cannabis sativa TaxID=3483 RepID=A0A803QSU7_CANSA